MSLTRKPFRPMPRTRTTEVLTQWPWETWADTLDWAQFMAARDIRYARHARAVAVHERKVRRV